MSSAQNLETIWSGRYRDAGDEYLFGTAPTAFLARRPELFSAGESAFLIAAGEGRNSVWLAVELRDRFDWVLGVFIQFVGGAEMIRQFSAIKQMTRSSGRVLLHGYTPKQLEYKTGGPSDIENMYTKELLRKEFASWDIEEMVEYEEDVAEGIRHNGRSALIGMIARKP